jgi:hypothetical protein
MRRRRQEQPVLETLGEIADGLGELAVDRITRAACRGRVVRFVEDQQRARPEGAKEVAKPGDVGLVGQEMVRYDEAGASRPGVDAEAAQTAQLADPVAVDDREGEPELGLELVLPLQGHRRRGGDDSEVDAAAQ